jgi:hypothetical protein
MKTNRSRPWRLLQVPNLIGLVLIAGSLIAGSLSIAKPFNCPQSRPEFVKAVNAGEGASIAETFVVDQDFESLYALVAKKSEACLDVTIERTAYVGYVEHSSSDYNPTLKRIGKDRAEFSLQVVHRPRAVGENAPPGGLYVMAADFRSIGKGRTEMVLYRSKIGFKKIVGGLKQWAEGVPADCPKMK